MRIVLISELTRLDLEVIKEGTVDSVRRNYEKELFTSDLFLPDTRYKAELVKVRRCILRQGMSIVDCLRHEAQNFIFRDDDMVVILGDDGAFVNIAKLLKNQKVVTIATATKRCGRLMKFDVDTFEKSAATLLAGTGECVRVSIARVETSLGHSLEAVNEFFVGRSDLRSSRYAIMQTSFIEQVSSGVIVSTGTGSTGWEKSVRLRDSRYRERELDDKGMNVITRELCWGDDVGVLQGVRNVVFRSDDNDTRIVADGVLLDASMLHLPAGATVIITANVRAINLSI